MNEQEIFEIITTGLSEQGKASLDSEGLCAYRGEDGMKCAIGFLIKDEFYDSSLEGYCIKCNVVLDAVSKSLGCTLEDHHKKFLADMQDTHDILAHWEDGFSGKRMRGQLRWVARNWALEFDGVQY